MNRFTFFLSGMLSVILFLCVVTDIAGSDSDLLIQYYMFNSHYFSGELPIEHVTVAWDGAISKSDMAGTWITHYEGEPEKIKMGISRYAKDCPNCVSMAILHEMVHVKLRGRKLKDIHGPEFQKEMLALAKQGAFDPYW